MKTKIEIAIAFLMILAMGCENNESGAALESSDGPGSNAVVRDSSERSLAVVDLGESSVEFVEVDFDGMPTLMMREETSSYVSETALDHLLAENLTFLEIFNAIAPDREAPVELVNSHASEAAEMGRENFSVRQVRVDAGRMTVKTTAQCDSMAFANTGAWEAVGTRRSANWLSGTQWLGAQDYTFLSGRVMLGWCNEHTRSMTARWGYRRQLPLEDWVLSVYTTLGGSSRTRAIFNVPTIYGQCNTSSCTGDCWSAGDLCFANSYGFAMAAGGAGSSYHLRTGVLYDIIR